MSDKENDGVLEHTAIEAIETRAHVVMLRQCAGIPGTPYHAAVRFALDCIRDRDLAHKQGYEEGYAAGRAESARP